MFKRLSVALLACVVGASVVAAEGRPETPGGGEAVPYVEGMTAKEIAAVAAAIVAASIAAYRQGGPGPCACPDDTDRAGKRCGKRSARDRAGGWTVYCYLSDVPATLIKGKASRASVPVK